MLRIHRFAALVALITSFVGSGLAQRPANASVCDYYAQVLYGANNTDTQHKLVRSIVSLAFAGGADVANVSADLTGILNPGKFGGDDIDLLPWFNGSKASTNVNNAPIGINWLDQGGRPPLVAYLNGETTDVVLTNTSNQYHLFGNFFVAFSRAFGCTLPFPPLPNSGGPLSLAYVHKFMNLEFNQLGYFINMLTLASIHFGFSEQDGQTFSTRLNSLYNVRCAPPVTFNPAMGPQLLSLCQNPTCPLAAPVSNCDAYVNLTATGAASSGAASTATVTNSATSLPSSSSTSSTATSATGAATSSAAPAASKSLSTGGIAGVAIGGAAVLVIAVLGLVFLLRRRRKTPPPSEDQYPPPPADMQEQQHNYPPSPAYPPYGGKDLHTSYYSTAPPASEMDSTRYEGSLGPGSMVGSPRSPRVGSPEIANHPSQQYPAPVEIYSAPVEMGGHEYVQPQPQHPGWQGDGVQR